MLHIKDVQVIGPFRLHLVFSDGNEKSVDLRPLLTGPVFEPLKDSEYFEQVSLDPVCKTIVWPNGADIAPEALYELEPCTKTPAR